MLEDTFSNQTILLRPGHYSGKQNTLPLFMDLVFGAGQLAHCELLKIKF